MKGSFTKGMIVGGLIGASLAMMNSDMMNMKNRKKMMKMGRNFLRRSGNIVSDIIDYMR